MYGDCRRSTPGRSRRAHRRRSACPGSRSKGSGRSTWGKGQRLGLAIEEDAGADTLHLCGACARCITYRVESLEGEPEGMTRTGLEVLENRDPLGRVSSRSGRKLARSVPRAAGRGKNGTVPLRDDAEVVRGAPFGDRHGDIHHVIPDGGSSAGMVTRSLDPSVPRGREKDPVGSPPGPRGSALARTASGGPSPP